MESGLTQSLLPAEMRVRLAEILPAGRIVHFAPREKLFCEGDPSDHIAILLAGIVKITASTANGREALLGLRGAGEVVGEIAALYGSPRSATVRALDDVRARLVPASAFVNGLRRHPDALFGLLHAVVGRLRESDRRRLEFAGSDVRERVARLLAELAGTHGEPAADGSVTIGLPLSQAEIAGATGASREAVAKALRVLRACGAVATSRQRITVLDRDALMRIPTQTAPSAQG
ncbi:Crp/Fnr family transcriptional regulator [Paractinoplanes durhamensis]|uniref:Crp/Fnr family transcriptional regulator n=1 Tax=Paractinoplanes durhamensis TaxID=113563 RepID=A0ABQ3Z6S2_9ACTN|nr:Crp/Fnr family transcriptional regulator [Actinoplanes durhamensis]GIE05518.1 Crp/Fnr family transcriptional regulator [Actinoplanes durhamensis]